MLFAVCCCLPAPAAGILNVSAKDGSSGRSNKITITNERGRLSQKEIERMVREAEEHADADRLAHDRVNALNGLEQTCYSTWNNLDQNDLKQILCAATPSHPYKLVDAVVRRRVHQN